MSPRSVVAVVLAALVALLCSATAANAASSLTVDRETHAASESLVATYATDRPAARNWVAVYADPGTAPVDGAYVGPSTVWRYAPGTSGTVEIPLTGLSAGTYVAYYLHDDGYERLAAPVRFRVTDGRPLRLVADELPLKNARVGEPYRASVGGLAFGETSGLRFSAVTAPSWLAVGPDGDLAGTPPATAGARVARATVRATNAAGETDTADVAIDVRPGDAPLVPKVRVLSFNLWHGGTQVRDGREKQLRFLLDRDVDVVGIQENEGVSTAELAKALGWSAYQASEDLGILSRYPIVRRGPSPSESRLPANDALIRLDPERGTDVAVWNVHLGYTPYGPYDACFGHYPVARLLQREAESGRTAQIQGVMDAMRADLRRSDRTQVLLTGDFNAPSHLDWTSRTARCGYGDVPWPTSVAPARAGLTDTFRQVHPDPVTSPGTTWSPIYSTFTGGYDHDDHVGEPEPLDRIDFVYGKGPWETTSSEAVVAGDPAKIPDHRDNEWTSDHAAVLTEFRVRDGGAAPGTPEGTAPGPAPTPGPGPAPTAPSAPGPAAAPNRAPAPPRAGRAKPARPVVSNNPLRASARRAVTLRIRCAPTSTPARCRGTVRLAVAGRTVGSRAFSVRSGVTTGIRVALTAAGHRALVSRRSLRAAATVRVRGLVGGTASRTTRLTLRAPER